MQNKVNLKPIAKAILELLNTRPGMSVAQLCDSLPFLPNVPHDARLKIVGDQLQKLTALGFVRRSFNQGQVVITDLPQGLTDLPPIEEKA